MVGHFFIVCASDRSSLGLHGYQTDIGLMAKVNGRIEFFILHEPEVIDGHNGVDPVQFSCSFQTVCHIFMGGEAEVANQAAFFGV